MGPERDVHAAVMDAEIGMVSLFLGDGRQLVDERHRRQKVDEVEALAQARLLPFLSNGPTGNLAEQLARRELIERRRPAFARNTAFIFQAHSSLPLNASRGFGTLSTR